MRKPVDVILPDAGPLITLAAADRLDLLQSFGRPVRVLDVIRAECLRDPSKLAHAELKQWFGHTGGNQHEIIDTPMMHAYRAALAMPTKQGSPPATKGLGDATLVWFERNLPTLHLPGTTSLVLTEDANLGDVRLGPKVHVLSTRALLRALENLGVIDSAASIIDAVQAQGRAPSRYMQDRRGHDEADDTTDWVEHARMLHAFKERGSQR